MLSGVPTLETGSRFWFEGEVWEVDTFVGDRCGCAAMPPSVRCPRPRCWTRRVRSMSRRTGTAHMVIRSPCPRSSWPP